MRFMSMKNKQKSPWDNITRPKTDSFHKQLVRTDLAIPCHWAKNHEGTPLFLIELEGDHKVAFNKKYLRINGIKIDLRSADTNKQVIALELEKHTNLDIFTNFCNALIEAIEPVNTSEAALGVIFNHLKRRKNFLSGKKALMSPEKVKGLFAELTFLEELLELKGDEIALNCWLGPEMSQHDFSFDNIDVEIKALGGTERNSIEISSEDQLYTLNKKLFLRIYTLGQKTDNSVGISLNQIVNQIADSISDEIISHTFYKKLSEYGYYPDLSYEKPSFYIRNTSTLEIVDSFPKIIKTDLPKGIRRVKYHLDLEEIKPFVCNNNKIFVD